MFECAMYGIIRREMDGKNTRFKRKEKIYVSGNSAYYAYIAGNAHHENADSSMHDDSDGRSEEKIELVYRSDPDRNRQRNTVVRVIERTYLETEKELEDLMEILGYRLDKENDFEGVLYERNSLQIECLKVPNEGFYLAKVSIETKSILYGEQLLIKASEDLKEEIKLVKPGIELFN